MGTISSDSPGSKGRVNKTLLIVGAVILVCCCLTAVIGLAGGIYFYSSSRSSTNPSAGPAATQSPQVKWLVTASELDSLSTDLGIVQWELYETTPGQYRVCNTFSGTSWSVTPNQATNCIYIVSPGSSLDGILKDMSDNGQLFPDEAPVQPTLNIPYEHALYVGTHSNAHAVMDLFVVKDGYLYWSSVTLGSPVGMAPVDIYQSASEAIDAFLYKVIEINMERSN